MLQRNYGVYASYPGHTTCDGFPRGVLILMVPLNDFHLSDLSKKPFFGGLVNYFASGPIVAMVWEGPDVILTGRKMLGATNPNSSEPGEKAQALSCVFTRLPLKY